MTDVSLESGTKASRFRMPRTAAERQRAFEIAAPWVFTLAFFLLWEVYCRVSGIARFVLPAPSVVFYAAYEFWWALLKNSGITLWRTVAGFALAVGFGLLLGLVIGSSRVIYKGLYPVLIGFNAIPKVAVVPILVLWYGIGDVPAVLTAFLISFFPIVVNVATGLATIEPEVEDVLRALGARKRDILVKVGLPRAMPYFFGSLKVAITLAFVGTVISETLAANEGLGQMILTAQANFEVPLVFAVLIALAIEGIVMYAIFAAIEQRMVGWAFRGSNAT